MTKRQLRWKWRGASYAARWFGRGTCPYLLGKSGSGIVVLRSRGSSAGVARVLKVAG